jgi:FtsP/CotA-like multicopper oxidase with cupredoxin domain
MKSPDPSRRCILPILAAVLVLLPAAFARAEAGAPRGALPDIVANDNRVAAGTADPAGVTIALVARRGLWYPDGPGTLGAPMNAFGEAGKPLRIPAPLIRVPASTPVTIRLRNALSGETLHVHGLASESMGDFPISIAGGQERVIRFRRDTPGTYVYWASDKSESLATRLGRDAGLSGAIIVDDPRRPRPADRVFVINTWIGVTQKDGTPNFSYELEAINGRSWPATEPLTYALGSVVRWRIVNGGLEPHAMHLHGFPFTLDAVGDGIHDLSLAGRPARREVTERLEPFQTFAMHWRAARAGMWMFHCHVAPHILAHAPMAVLVAGRPPAPHALVRPFHFDGADSMGGMILAVRVTPAANAGDMKPWVARHTVAIDVVDRSTPRPHDFAAGSYAYVVTDRGAVAPPSGIIGPPIVLTAGEPTAIAVTNHLHEATAVHWHGVEIASSYDDGAAGMPMLPLAMAAMPAPHADAKTAAGGMMAPPIEPGQTFTAHVTAPHAGTFMYHTHMDDTWQLVEGLAGPLIVMPPGQAFDAATDHIVMLTSGPDHPLGDLVYVNGSLTPEPIALHAGVPQRLRLINMTAVSTDIVVSLQGAADGNWTPLAKDGIDLDPRLQQARTATSQLTIGETRDFRFTPTAPGDLTLQMFDTGTKVGSVTLRVLP